MRSMYGGGMIGIGAGGYAVLGYLVERSRCIRGRYVVEVDVKELGRLIGAEDAEISGWLGKLEERGVVKEEPVSGGISKWKGWKRYVLEDARRYRVIRQRSGANVRDVEERKGMREAYAKVVAEKAKVAEEDEAAKIVNDRVKEILKGVGGFDGAGQAVKAKWEEWVRYRIGRDYPEVGWDAYFKNQVNWLGRYKPDVVVEILDSSIKNRLTKLYGP